MKLTNIFKITLVAIIFLTSSNGFPQGYKGSEFLDANKNGIIDQNEKGI